MVWPSLNFDFFMQNLLSEKSLRLIALILSGLSGNPLVARAIFVTMHLWGISGVRLKVEETHGQDFATRVEAWHCVFDWIKGWYNTTRMHSSLGYQSSAGFERERSARSVDAANDGFSTYQYNNGFSARLIKGAA
jgi:Integrase core domain